MTDHRNPSLYIEGALISGWPAFAFARILARHWRDEVEDLRPHLRAPLEDAREALEHAALHFATERGSAEAAPSEAEATSDCKDRDELTTAEVADVLKVTERRVRQLARDHLNGKRRQGRWYFDRGAVIAYRERKNT